MKWARRDIELPLLVGAFLAACGPADRAETVFTDFPLHMEAHVESSRITGSEPPAERPVVDWRFDEPQPDWRSVQSDLAPWLEVHPARTDDVLRIELTEANRQPGGGYRGAIFVTLPDWRRDEWDHLLIRARATDGVRSVRLFQNLGVRTLPGDGEPIPFLNLSDGAQLLGGGVNTYRLRADWSPERWGEWKDPWRELVLLFGAREPGVVEILSVTAVSKAAAYGDGPTGVMSLGRNGDVRWTLAAHAPGRLAYRIRPPGGARLDFGLGTVRAGDTVTFRVTATRPGARTDTLFEERHSDARSWVQRSVDMSDYAGLETDVALEADADREGAVALWAAPTLGGSSPSRTTNVILYFVDGLGAEYMSLYGYPLADTPNLERLAEEGALFEHAYTNSRWTTPSTTTAMTSLYHSVVGGSRAERLNLPAGVSTMAQRFHRAGYQTAVLTGNPSAGRTAGLGREVDVLRDWLPWDGSVSAPRLQARFWDWRGSYPGRPFWVHFQTIDVWGPGWLDPEAPFAGAYVSASDRRTYFAWRDTLRAQNPGHWWRPDQEAFDRAGIDRVAYFELGQKIYAEGVARQDHEIGRFVDQLKAAGEWENTLFIVSSDHGQHEAGLVRLDPYAPQGEHTHLRSEHTGIPLLVLWPGHISGGVRFRTPVSLVDLLPTVLELAGLPPPDIAQGRSLAPLLLGTVPESEWESRPVLLDEFYADGQRGGLKGWIEVVDGRWGASLEVGAPVEPAWAGRGEYDDAIGGRPTPLLVYDLWNDPYCLSPVNEERPDLVETYREMLEERFEAHRLLREHVGTGAGEIELTSDQLRTLRSLGYIQ